MFFSESHDSTWLIHFYVCWRYLQHKVPWTPFCTPSISLSSRALLLRYMSIYNIIYIYDIVYLYIINTYILYLRITNIMCIYIYISIISTGHWSPLLFPVGSKGHPNCHWARPRVLRPWGTRWLPHHRVWAAKHFWIPTWGCLVAQPREVDIGGLETHHG